MDERTFCVIDVDSCQFFEDPFEADIPIGDILQTLSEELQKNKENLFIMTSKGVLCENERPVSEYLTKDKVRLLLFDRGTPGYFYPQITKNWEEFEEFPEHCTGSFEDNLLAIKGLEDTQVLASLRKVFDLSSKAKEFYAKYFTLHRFIYFNFEALSTKLKGAKVLLRFLEVYFQGIYEECKGLSKKLQKIKERVVNDAEKNCGKLRELKENALKKCFGPGFVGNMQKRCVSLIKKLEKMLKNLQVKHLDKLDEDIFEKQESYSKLKSGFKALQGTINKAKIMNESTESMLFNHLEVCTEFKLLADDLLAWSISKTPGVLSYWNSPGKQVVFEQFSLESSKLEKILQKLEIFGLSLDQKKTAILSYYQKYVEFVHRKTSYLKVIVKQKILKVSDALKDIRNSYRFLIEPEFFIEHQGAIAGYLQRPQGFQCYGVVYSLLKALVADYELRKEFVECYGKVLPSQFFSIGHELFPISSLERTLLTLKGPFTNDLDFSTVTEDHVHSFYSDQLAQLSSAYNSKQTEIMSSISKHSAMIKDLEDLIKISLKAQEDNRNELINLHEELKILNSDSSEETIFLNTSLLHTAFEEFASHQTKSLQSSI